MAIAETSLVQTSLIAKASTSPAASNTIGGFFADPVGRIAAWWSYRQTVRALAALTDRELADIGLARGDIKYVARVTR